MQMSEQGLAHGKCSIKGVASSLPSFPPLGGPPGLGILQARLS